MSNNLDFVRKIANQNTPKSNAIAACTSIRKSAQTAKLFKFQTAPLIGNADKQELPARNYCDDDLDTLYNPRDWYDDTWWRL